MVLGQCSRRCRSPSHCEARNASIYRSKTRKRTRFEGYRRIEKQVRRLRARRSRKLCDGRGISAKSRSMRRLIFGDVFLWVAATMNRGTNPCFVLCATRHVVGTDFKPGSPDGGVFFTCPSRSEYTASDLHTLGLLKRKRRQERV